MGREDIELFAVFGDGAAGDFDSLFCQGFGDRVVGKGLGEVFLGDELLDGFADSGVGDFGPVLGVVSGGEEGAHFHETVGV